MNIENLCLTNSENINITNPHLKFKQNSILVSNKILLKLYFFFLKQNVLEYYFFSDW